MGPNQIMPGKEQHPEVEQQQDLSISGSGVLPSHSEKDAGLARIPLASSFFDSSLEQETVMGYRKCDRSIREGPWLG